VRVELDLGPVPGDAEAVVAELEAVLERPAGAECEGLLVESLDTHTAQQLAVFARALEAAGLECPLAVRVEAGWAVHCASVASRLVVMLGALVSDDHLAAAVDCAAERGLPLEWELRGPLEEIPALVDRALEAAAAGGARDLLVSVDAEFPVHAARLAAARLRARGAAGVPIVLRHRRDRALSDEEALLRAGTDLGAPLCDGIGDAVCIAAWDGPQAALDLAYRILQGARVRTTRTEFISCPSCGRTLFGLEQTTARIKARTEHLAGVKIAIMGCIVNGPGEMADADFGYVGSGPGVVNLYVGKQCVARKVPDSEADDLLVELIKRHGRWRDPSP
jgi:hypothetical protein